MMRFSTTILLSVTVLMSAGTPLPQLHSQPQPSEVEAPTILARSRRRSAGGTGRRLILSSQLPISQSV